MASTIHLREAKADSYQEWKSTLAVAPTEPLEPPRTRGTFKLAEEIKNCKCDRILWIRTFHSDLSGFDPRLACPQDSDESRLTLWNVFVG